MSFFETIRINDRETVDVKHLLYYQTARNSLEDAKEIHEHRNESDTIELLANSTEVQKRLHISVIFFYLTIESYINFYAIKNKIKNRKELKKDSTIEKWKKYPEEKREKRPGIVTGSVPDTGYGNRVEKLLEKLNNKRNHIVHHKPRLINVEGPDIDYLAISIEECEGYYQTIKELMQELKRIDTDAYIDWINK